MGLIFQELNLNMGDKAVCTAGYPNKGTIVVECIKPFDQARHSLDLVNNPKDFIKVTDKGRYGDLTSHYISANWSKI